MFNKDDVMDAECSAHGEMRNAYKIVEKPERKRPFERTRRRWEDNTDLRKIVFEGVD
jgi:hypothetical protein